MTRWPWVSRELHDRVSTLLATEAAQWRQLYEMQIEASRTLMATILGMRKEGFTPPPDTSPVQQPQSVDAADEDAALAWQRTAYADDVA